MASSSNNPLDFDEEALMAKLTLEEIQALQEDLLAMDPDDSTLPASMRQADQTNKKPTGEYNPENLKSYLIDQAKNTQDIEDLVPYQANVKRGKVYQASKKNYKDDGFGGGEIKLDPELEEAFKNASSAEIADLAAVMGLHQMLDNDTFEKAMNDPDSLRDGSSGPLGKIGQPVKCDLPMMVDEDLSQIEPNRTDPIEMLDKLRTNDPSTKEINLNNIRNISISTLQDYGKSLSSNTHLTSLQLVGTKTNDIILKSISEGLKTNTTLRELNLETNYLSARGIINFIKTLNESNNTSLQELRIDNQKTSFGSGGEEKLVKELDKNYGICKFSYSFQSAAARYKAIQITTRNLDRIRKQRMGHE